MSEDRGARQREYLKLAGLVEAARQEIDFARQQSAKSHHLFVRSRRAAVQAARAVIAAVDAGLPQPALQWILSGMRKPDDKSRAPATLSIGGVKMQVVSMRVGSGCEPDGKLQDDTAFELWKWHICPMLRSKESTLKADAGAFDFPRVKVDENGHVLGRDGKPLGRREILDPETGEVVGVESTGDAATQMDDYDEADLLEHLRCQAVDWSDACGIAAGLLRDEAEHVESLGSADMAKPGSFQAQRSLAAREADTAEEQVRGSDLATLCCHARLACRYSVEIAKASRAKSPVSPVEFVGNVVRLVEHLTRAEALVSVERMNAWPTTPGTTLSWKSGDSALDVALKFARMIHPAVEVGRLEAIGGANVEDLQVSPECDDRFAKWRDSTIVELHTRTLPALPEWPMHDIHRDFGVLESKLRDESRRAGISPTVPGAPKMAAATRNKVFISYSHKDKKFLDQLLTHLKPIERAGRLSHWSDKQIDPSSKWFAEIQKALDESKVAALLVTPHFLASDFIHEHELGPLLKKAATGGVKIMWILVRACNYKETSLPEYHAAYSLEKPLAEMKAERDRAWVAISQELAKAAV